MYSLRHTKKNNNNNITVCMCTYAIESLVYSMMNIELCGGCALQQSTLTIRDMIFQV